MSAVYSNVSVIKGCCSTCAPILYHGEWHVCPCSEEITQGKSYCPVLICLIQSIPVTKENILRERVSDTDHIKWCTLQKKTENTQKYFRDCYCFFRLICMPPQVSVLHSKSKWTHFPWGSSGQWSVNKSTVMRRRMSLSPGWHTDWLTDLYTDCHLVG